MQIRKVSDCCLKHAFFLVSSRGQVLWLQKDLVAWMLKNSTKTRHDALLVISYQGPESIYSVLGVLFI